MQKNEDKSLFVVQDTFEISNRGLVLTPGTGKEEPEVAVGDEIILSRPDCSALVSKIAGIEMIKYHTIPKEKRFPILLPKEIKKEDVPKGTRVFRRIDLEHIQSELDNA